MQTITTLQPGQKGTKRLHQKYGDRLVTVRHRYDPETGRKYITVELIEETTEPTSPAITQSQQPTSVPPASPLGIRVEYSETDLRERVKAAGGIWRPRQKLWELRYEDIVALGLESRIVADDSTQP